MRFISGVTDILQDVSHQESKVITRAAESCAASIENERAVLLFGAGHSALPCQEAFPRIGSIVGFVQITEPGLSFNGHVTGKGGQRQMSFLEQQAGFAEIILANYDLDEKDTMIVFSNSGINALPVEMCALGNKAGLTTIGISSKAHSFANQPRNKYQKRLLEIADIAIDNHTPENDALIPISPEMKSGGSSTIINMVIMNSIVVETTEILQQKGIPFHIYPSHNVSEDYDQVLQQEKIIFQAYKDLISKL